MDMADPLRWSAALERWQPWAVVNTAGFVRVDDAERRSAAWRENMAGPVRCWRGHAPRAASAW